MMALACASVFATPLALLPSVLLLSSFRAFSELALPEFALLAQSALFVEALF